MNELLKVEIHENHEQIISGRVLHQFLGISAEYAKWFERKCEFGFIENTDYKTVFYGKDLSEVNFDDAIKMSPNQRSAKGIFCRS